MLRADLIVSSQEVDEVGLIFVGQEEDRFLYADTRLPQPFQDTSSMSIEEAQAVSPTQKIYFHPFRFAVLQSFELLVPSFTLVQMLYPQLYRMQEIMAIWHRMIKPAQRNFQRAQIWNDIVSLLVATEPCFYQHIFQHLHVRLFQTRPTPRRWSQEDDSDTSIASRESLRSDIRMGIFSFVSLDTDVSRNLQTIRAAAQQDQICGSFFISSPDFEFADFNLSELQEIVWNIALERGADVTKKSILLAVTSTATKGKTFFQKVEIGGWQTTQPSRQACASIHPKMPVSHLTM